MIPIDLWRARIGLFNCKRCSSFLFSPSPCSSFHRPPRKRHKVVTEESSIANSPTENSDNHTSHSSTLPSNSLHLSGDCSPFPLKEQSTSPPPDYSATASITTTSSSSSSSWSGSLSSLRCSLLRDVLIILLIAIISQQLIVLSGDIETNPGPKHKVDEKPALNDLQYMSIAGEDGETCFRFMERLQVRWRKLAIALKFSLHSIEAIEHNKDSIYKLLSDWLQGANMEEDTRPVTWRTLIEALHEAKIHEEADTLEKHFVLTEKSVVASQFGKRKHSSEVEENQAEGTASMVQEPKRAKVDEISSFPSDEHELSFSESLPLTGSSILEQFVGYLKHIYLTTEVHHRSLVSLDISDKCFLQPFELRVCNCSTNMHSYKHCQNQWKAKLDMADVGKCTGSTGQVAKSILVEGCPGVGKSVLAWKLCKGWAEGELLQEWPIVILLNFRNRHVREAKTVHDLIYHPDQTIREKISCQELLESEGTQVLFILDGYDQLSVKQQRNCSVFKKLINFPKASLMVFSRPAATGTLPKEFGSSINQHIEISGFTEENVNCFITTACHGDHDLAAALSSYLSSQSLSYLQIHTPLQCTILTDLYCFHWKNGDKSFGPRTRTELYTDLVRTLLVQYLSSHSEYSKREWHIVEFTDLPGEVYEQFKALAQLAARGIQEREYVFDSDSVPKDTLGLMYQVEEVYLGSSRSVSYSFLYLPLQEYLAAYYCSLEDPDVRLTRVLNIKEPIERFLNLYWSDEMVDYKHHWPVLLFAASITKLSWNPQALCNFLQIYDYEASFVASSVHLLYEIHSPELIALTFQSTMEQSTDFKLKIAGQNLSDLYVTGYCIPCSKSMWQYTPHYYVTTEHFQVLCKGLELVSSNSGGQIAKMEVNYRHVSMLSLLHPHTLKLKELKITDDDNKFSLLSLFSNYKKCTEKISFQFSFYYPFLEVLAICCDSSDLVDQEFFESLIQLNFLEQLRMRLRFSSSAEIRGMCLYLQACQQIKSLVLENTNFTEKYTLPLMISHKLESLALEQFSLTSKLAECIGKKSFSLHTLCLKACIIPSDASTALVQSLQSPHCVLHTLELSDALQDKIMTYRVPNALLKICSLKRCILRFKYSSQLKHLISGLKDNNTLDELWVLEEPFLMSRSDFHHCSDDEFRDLIRMVNDNTSIKLLKLSSVYERVSEELNIRSSLQIDYVANPRDKR